MVVGKSLSFELEDTSTAISKSFGSVIVNGENLAHAIVAAGWAKVKPPMGNNPSRTADHEELVRLEAQVRTDLFILCILRLREYLRCFRNIDDEDLPGCRIRFAIIAFLSLSPFKRPSIA